MCEICSLTFTTKVLLSSHSAVHSEERSHPCTRCGRAFRWESSLVSHVRAAHGTGQTFTCEVCGKVFKVSRPT